MAYLSDTARHVLEAAAQRDDLSVLPLPETVKAKGGAMQKVLTGLRNRGFVQVIESDGPQRVVITGEGMAAIGGGLEGNGDDSPATEADTGPTTAEADAPAENAPAAEEPAPADTEADASEAAPAARPRAVRQGTKQAQMIDLLKRPEGATIDQIAKATGWQHHTIRGAISGALKKKLSLSVTSEKRKDGGRAYRIADGGGS